MITITVTPSIVIAAKSVTFTSDDPEEFRLCVELLKAAIPAYARKFDSHRRCWHVTHEALGELELFLREAARELGAQVRREDGRQQPRRPAQADPYAALHLLPSAPPEVIKAAYRALAQLHHPDRGGDTRTMQQINLAYDELERRLAA